MGFFNVVFFEGHCGVHVSMSFFAFGEKLPDGSVNFLAVSSWNPAIIGLYNCLILLDVRTTIDCQLNRIQTTKETSLWKCQGGTILSKLFEVERHTLAVAGTIGLGP